MFGFVLFSSVFARELRTLHVKEAGIGDCIANACDFDTASHTLRNGDTVYFDQDKIEITSFPSAFSDLLHTAMFMNVTFISASGKTEINGRFMAGEQLFDIHSASRYCWARFIGFTFTHFEKKVLTRTMTENQWPLINFKECTFTENNDDIIDVNGGTFQFDNCVFSNNRKRPIKAVKEALIECNDCRFSKSESLFFSDCDFIMNNCIFQENFGSRGGAIYTASATMTLRACKFIRNNARINGGAIYVRLSIADYASDIKDCAFVDNTAKENGTAIYTYLSEVLLENNCFSGEQPSEYIQNQSTDKLVNNEFKSDCTRLLQYEPKRDDFTPLEPNPVYDVDVDVAPNIGIEL